LREESTTLKRVHTAVLGGLVVLLFISTGFCEEAAGPPPPPGEGSTQVQQVKEPAEVKKAEKPPEAKQAEKPAEAKKPEAKKAEKPPEPQEPKKPLSMEQLRERLESLEKEMRVLREEAEARGKLAVTEKEKITTERAEEILKAASQRYILLKKDRMELEYNFDYGYYSNDILTSAGSFARQRQHSITNTVGVTFGLRDNLSLNARFPFVYKYEKTNGTQTSDIGDISFGVEYQPVKGGGKVAFHGVSRNPYDQYGKEPL
jgi:flagellar biosynthesis GTPase FlhF